MAKIMLLSGCKTQRQLAAFGDQSIWRYWTDSCCLKSLKSTFGVTKITMKRLTPLFTFGVLSVFVSIAFAQTTGWKKPYSGDDATGDHVKALWHFDSDNPAKDASGN